MACALPTPVPPSPAPPPRRYLFRDWVESTLKSKWARWAIIDKAIEHDGWKLVLIMRFSPIIPYNLVRPLLGQTGHSCRACCACAAGQSMGEQRQGVVSWRCTCVASAASAASPRLPCTVSPPPLPPRAAQHRDGHHLHPLLAVHHCVGGGHCVRVRRVCLLWQVWEGAAGRMPGAGQGTRPWMRRLSHPPHPPTHAPQHGRQHPHGGEWRRHAPRV